MHDRFLYRALVCNLHERVAIFFGEGCRHMDIERNRVEHRFPRSFGTYSILCTIDIPSAEIFRSWQKLSTKMPAQCDGCQKILKRRRRASSPHTSGLVGLDHHAVEFGIDLFPPEMKRRFPYDDSFQYQSNA
jgi:hypothetical protein